MPSVAAAAAAVSQRRLPLRLARGVVPASIASRNEDRARRHAAEYGLGSAYGSYEALLTDMTLNAFGPLVVVGSHQSSWWGLI